MLIFSLNSFLKVLTSFVHCCEFLIQWGSLDCWFLPGRGDSTRLWRYTCAIKVIIYKSIQIKHLRAVVAQGLCTRFIIPEHHYNLVDSIGNANKPEESSNPLVAPEKLYTTALTWWRHISPAFSESWPAWRTGFWWDVLQVTSSLRELLSVKMSAGCQFRLFLCTCVEISVSHFVLSPLPHRVHDPDIVVTSAETYISPGRTARRN